MVNRECYRFLNTLYCRLPVSARVAIARSNKALYQLFNMNYYPGTINYIASL